MLVNLAVSRKERRKQLRNEKQTAARRAAASSELVAQTGDPDGGSDA